MKRKLFTAALVTGVLMSGVLMSLAPVKAEGPDKLVTIVTTPEPQTQLMAMVLTMQSVQQKASARILLCGPAGDLALKDAPESATAPQAPKGMSPQGLMKKIMEAGARVEVCAIYLPNKGGAPEALLDGVGVAKPPEMAGAIMADDTRVMSF
ncbi:hypothetical protein [uncultured Roseibium sp.]|uniref:hypothetical protein n=1 Tax=uncultured Roseibium sp. TaxID=1936171 RepID=UPI003217B34F